MILQQGKGAKNTVSYHADKLVYESCKIRPNLNFYNIFPIDLAPNVELAFRYLFFNVILSFSNASLDVKRMFINVKFCFVYS